MQTLEHVSSIRELVTSLQLLRTGSGSPSYAELASRIGALRAARGLPAAHAAPSKSTVYEAFKPERKRVDAALIDDIVRALDPSSDPRQWRDAALRLSSSGPLHLPEILPVREAATDPFVGRQEALRELVSRVRSEGAVDIVGLPGIGKSALASRVAAELSPGFDETLWISMRGHSAATLPVDPEALARALLARWEHTFEPSRLLEEVARRLRNRSVLLVLDDAVNAEQVRPFLTDPAGKSRLLVTSRRALGVTGEFHLEPLDETESLQLLGLSGSEPGASSLVGSCGGLPLALEIAVSRIRERPNWSMADHAAAAQTRPDAFDALNQRIQHSYTLMPADLRSALTKLAQLPGTHGELAGAQRLLGTDPDDAERMLTRLAQTGLIRTGDAGWSMHDLVRAFAVAAAHDSTPPSELFASFSRYVDHMIETTTAALLALDVMGLHMAPWAEELALEPISQEEARGWLETQIPTVFATAAKAVERSDLESAARFATLMYSLGLVGTDGEAALELQRTTRVLAERVGNRFEQMRALMREGALLVFRLGRAEEASLPLKWGEDLCLAMMEHPEAVASLASIKNSQAAVATLADDLAGAETAFRELLPYVRQSGDVRLEFPVLVNLVEVLNRLGKVEEGSRVGLEAFERSEQLGKDRETLALSLNVTDGLISCGDLAKAWEVSERGVAIALQLQHTVPLGFLRVSRAIVKAKQSQFDDAYVELAEGNDLARQTRHRELTASTVQAEARILMMQGKLRDAEAAAERAIEAASNSADTGRVRTAQALLADIQAQLDQQP